MTGSRAAYTHTLVDTHTELGFEDVHVPAANLIGSEGDGLRFVYSWFRYERLMIAARCCGAAERLIDEATAFAKDRVQFGRPIIENQAIAHMLADSVTELWAARLMTYELAKNIDRGVDLKVQHAQCSMVKLYASEMAGRVADRAVQIFGGRGYMRENVAERFWREVRVDRIWRGPPRSSATSWPTSSPSAAFERSRADPVQGSNRMNHRRGPPPGACSSATTRNPSRS